ncbi:phage baseplate plug protein [Asaia sp. VD9]|uniref:phage baseplate plug family protein n=1 Tax=Asaia sp. VD9 TaxID=3081235 RepID=UPI003017DE9E
MATSFYEVPLVSAPQSFSTDFNGSTYSLRFTFQNVDQGGWLLDIYDTSANPIVVGIPLVTGADLLAQYAYLGLGVSLYLVTDGDSDAVPTFADLGVASHLYLAVTS